MKAGSETRGSVAARASASGIGLPRSSRHRAAASARARYRSPAGGTRAHCEPGDGDEAQREATAAAGPASARAGSRGSARGARPGGPGPGVPRSGRGRPTAGRASPAMASRQPQPLQARERTRGLVDAVTGRLHGGAGGLERLAHPARPRRSRDFAVPSGMPSAASLALAQAQQVAARDNLAFVLPKVAERRADLRLRLPGERLELGAAARRRGARPRRAGRARGWRGSPVPRDPPGGRWSGRGCAPRCRRSEEPWPEPRLGRNRSSARYAFTNPSWAASSASAAEPVST